MEPTVWKPFWWESNECWGVVDTPEAWDAMVEKYKEGKPKLSLKEAREDMIDCGALTTWRHSVAAMKAGNLVNIGTHAEHVGGVPFSSWLIRNGMYETAMGVEPDKKDT